MRRERIGQESEMQVVYIMVRYTASWPRRDILYDWYSLDISSCAVARCVIPVLVRNDTHCLVILSGAKNLNAKHNRDSSLRWRSVQNDIFRFHFRVKEVLPQFKWKMKHVETSNAILSDRQMPIHPISVRRNRVPGPLSYPGFPPNRGYPQRR